MWLRKLVPRDSESRRKKDLDSSGRLLFKEGDLEGLIEG